MPDSDPNLEVAIRIRDYVETMKAEPAEFHKFTVEAARVVRDTGCTEDQAISRAILHRVRMAAIGHPDAHDNREMQRLIAAVAAAGGMTVLDFSLFLMSGEGH